MDHRTNMDVFGEEKNLLALLGGMFAKEARLKKVNGVQNYELRIRRVLCLTGCQQSSCYEHYLSPEVRSIDVCSHAQATQKITL